MLLMIGLTYNHTKDGKTHTLRRRVILEADVAEMKDSGNDPVDPQLISVTHSHTRHCSVR